MNSVSSRISGLVGVAERTDPVLEEIAARLGARLLNFARPAPGSHEARAETERVAVQVGSERSLSVSMSRYSVNDPDGDLVAEQCSHCHYHRVVFARDSANEARPEEHTCLEWGDHIDLFRILPLFVTENVTAMNDAVREAGSLFRTSWL